MTQEIKDLQTKKQEKELLGKNNKEETSGGLIKPTW